MSDLKGQIMATIKRIENRQDITEQRILDTTKGLQRVGDLGLRF